MVASIPGGALVVIVTAYYSEDSSLIPADHSKSFGVLVFYERTKYMEKQDGGDSSLKMR